MSDGWNRKPACTPGGLTQAYKECKKLAVETENKTVKEIDEIIKEYEKEGYMFVSLTDTNLLFK